MVLLQSSKSNLLTRGCGACSEGSEESSVSMFVCGLSFPEPPAANLIPLRPSLTVLPVKILGEACNISDHTFWHTTP